jgi:guanylate kinase
MERAGERARAERPSGPRRAQRLQALAQANRVRSERAQIKAALRRGELRAGALLADPPECLEGASLAELLLAVPGVGQARLRRVLNGCRLSPAKPVGRLTARQRHALAEALGALG